MRGAGPARQSLGLAPSFETGRHAGARGQPFFRLAALGCVSAAMLSSATAQDAKPDVVEVHGKPLPLSCAEWKQNPDGSWTSIGALLVGTDTLKNVTLRAGKETKVLDEKCRNPGSSAPPAQGLSPAKHDRQKARPAAG